MMVNTRFLLLATLLVLAATPTWAIERPTLNNPSSSDIFTNGSSLVNSVEYICYILGAICAMIGGVLTYTEVIDGEENFFVAVRNWFGSCIALVALPYLIRQLAGV